jgi:molecular chaperone DnaK (HSP70)
MRPWMLAVDFGTTNTAAAICPVGAPERATPVALSSAATAMPSAVLVTKEGLVTGDSAVHGWAVAPPGSFEPTPKRRVGEGEVLLGGRQWGVDELVGAVLAEVVRRAARQHDGAPPAAVRLTHPAAWSRMRLEVLRRAAERASLPDVTLIPEPVAAAAHYASTHEGAGDLVAVYDLGGGTMDVAVLQRTTGPQGGGARRGCDAKHGRDRRRGLPPRERTPRDQAARVSVWARSQAWGASMLSAE